MESDNLVRRGLHKSGLKMTASGTWVGTVVIELEQMLGSLRTLCVLPLWHLPTLL